MSDKTTPTQVAQPAKAGSVVEEIRAFNQDRKPRLLALKYERMAADAFAFFRGTLHVFARRWSGFAPADAGPEILSCGDLHIENFGAFQTDDALLGYDVNDFDEALVAPSAFDLVRLAASIRLAAEAWQLDVDQARQTATMLLANYCHPASATAWADGADPLGAGQGSGPIWELLSKAAVSTVADLLDRHTRVEHGGERRIVRSDDKHYELNDDRVKKVTRAVEEYGRRRGAAAAFRVLDVTGRIAGIGSLGLRRAMVLVAGEGSPDGNKLLDIKECRPSSAARWVGRAMPCQTNDAQRVVLAQRQLQVRLAAGLDVLEIGSGWYRMRALVPDENRSKLDRLKGDPARFRAAIAALGPIVGRSHARGADYARTGSELALFAQVDRMRAVLEAADCAAAAALADYREYRRAYEAGAFHLDSE